MHGMRYRSFEALLGLRHPLSLMHLHRVYQIVPALRAAWHCKWIKLRFELVNVHIADFLWHVYSLE